MNIQAVALLYRIKYASALNDDGAIFKFFEPQTDTNDAADLAWQEKLQSASKGDRKTLEVAKWLELKPIVMKMTGGAVDHALEQAVARTGDAQTGVRTWERASQFLALLNSQPKIHNTTEGGKFEFDCLANLSAIYEKRGHSFIHKTFLLPRDNRTGVAGPIKKELERIAKR